jgi:hypothetical protein
VARATEYGKLDLPAEALEQGGETFDVVIVRVTEDCDVDPLLVSEASKRLVDVLDSVLARVRDDDLAADAHDDAIALADVDVDDLGRLRNRRLTGGAR